ncbi:MAG TPA: hypothetical protein VKY65_17095 [Alphaproteobacteria bacterium]|nr:hypothetical protein [Alphaproteobacteria bacterium]
MARTLYDVGGSADLRHATAGVKRLAIRESCSLWILGSVAGWSVLYLLLAAVTGH